MKRSSVSMLFFLLACAQSPETKLEVSTSYLMTGASGGAVLYLTNLDRKTTRTIILEENETTLTVENGNWEFVSVLWAGDEPLKGSLKCDRKTASLSGTAARIELEPSIANCDSDFFSPSAFRNAGATRALRLVNCADTSSVSGGTYCDDSARGKAESYRIRLVASDAVADVPGGPAGARLASGCIPAAPAPNSITATTLQLPYGGPNFRPSYVVDTFKDPVCTLPLLSMRLPQGLAKPVPASSVAIPSPGSESFSDLYLEASVPDVVATGFTGSIGQLVARTLTLTNSTPRPISELQLFLPRGFTYEGGAFPGAGAVCDLPLALGDDCTLALTFLMDTSGARNIPMAIDFNNGHPKKTMINLSTYGY